jgi:hypothetical protein
MTDRKTLDQMTSDQLDDLYARIATLEHVAASNKRHVQLIVPDLERAEAAIERVRHLAARIRQGVPWTANDDDIAARILAALDELAPGPDPSGVANAVAALAKHVKRAANFRQSDFALTTDAPAAPMSDPAATQATDAQRYADDVECAIGLNVDCGGTEGVHRVRDAVLAVRDRDMERLRATLQEILALFTPATINSTTAFYQATEHPIAPADYDRWRAALDQPKE